MTKDNSIIKAIKEGNFDKLLIETARNNFREGQKQKEAEILRIIRDIAKEEIRNLKHEKNHPVNKALGEDTYNMELEIAEWEDFLNTFEQIQDKIKSQIKNHLIVSRYKTS